MPLVSVTDTTLVFGLFALSKSSGQGSFRERKPEAHRTESVGCGFWGGSVSPFLPATGSGSAVSTMGNYIGQEIGPTGAHGAAETS